MSPYAYAYRTRIHPCAYACACVIRVNQALMCIQTLDYSGILQVGPLESTNVNQYYFDY